MIKNAAIIAKFQLAYPAMGGFEPFSLDVDLLLPGQGTTGIFGRSGSGKTTLLRCIAGLQQVKAGQLCVNGEIWQNANIHLPTQHRTVGYVFQEASLFPHLTVHGNLNYAAQRTLSKNLSASFDRVVGLMDVDKLLDRRPDQLSGGEGQRVAMARALLSEPKLLLMDEPMASLDTAHRQEILPYLAQLRDEFAIPMIYVSHSVTEMLHLADHLVVLEQGKVMMSGQAPEVLSRLDLPQGMGEDLGIVIEAQVTARDTRWRLIQVDFTGGKLWLKDTEEPIGSTIRIRILARDISLALAAHTDTSILNCLSVKVIDILPAINAAMALVRLQLNDIVLVSLVTKRSVNHLQLETGSRVWAQIKSVAIVR